MDQVTAFSVAAGVGQFVDLATKVFTNLLSYFQAVKGAPKLSKELQQEALFVCNILTELKATLESMDTKSEIIKPNQNLNDTVMEFASMMKETQIRLEVKEGEWSTRRLKWPFTEKENGKYLSRFERYKSTFTLALNIIQGYILPTLFEAQLMWKTTVTRDCRRHLSH
jgi:hypothetical protein